MTQQGILHFHVQLIMFVCKSYENVKSHYNRKLFLSYFFSLTLMAMAVN